MKAKAEILKIENQDKYVCWFELNVADCSESLYEEEYINLCLRSGEKTKIVPLDKKDYEYASTRVGDKMSIKIHKGIGSIINS